MKNIIKITENKIGLEKVNCVNSRELYEFLGVKRQYADWIKEAIIKYDFIENEDYLIHKNVKKLNDGVCRPSIDYIVTLDMAKELAMLSNTKKGKETRKYFIACEKNLKDIANPSLARTQTLARLENQIRSLTRQNDSLKVQAINSKQENIISLIEKGLAYDDLAEKYLILKRKQSSLDANIKEVLYMINQIDINHLIKLKRNLVDILID